MRRAVVLTVSTTVAILACRDFLTTEPPQPPARAVVARVDSTPRTDPADTVSVVEIDRLQLTIDSLMVAIQRTPGDVGAIRALADLHLRMGWDEQAIPALARALELDPRSPRLRRDLDAALGRVGWEAADLGELARRFVELVEMWGHGC